MVSNAYSDRIGYYSSRNRPTHNWIKFLENEDDLYYCSKAVVSVFVAAYIQVWESPICPH